MLVARNSIHELKILLNVLNFSIATVTTTGKKFYVFVITKEYIAVTLGNVKRSRHAFATNNNRCLCPIERQKRKQNAALLKDFNRMKQTTDKTERQVINLSRQEWLKIKITFQTLSQFQ